MDSAEMPSKFVEFMFPDETTKMKADLLFGREDIASRR
jgi:hypothetical protein